jgi:hypothetical protein
METGNNVLTYEKGKFRVQLEIPEYSTLSGMDIDKILSIASWKKDVNEQIYRSEGGRSVLIERSEPAYNNGMELDGLQISGVGYISITESMGDTLFSHDGNKIVPPSHENFRKIKMGKRMKTSTIVNGTFCEKVTGYDPLGSYTEENMFEKVKNTRLACSMKNVAFSVPLAEAYGRYNDISHDGSNLSFSVFSVPHPGEERFMAYLMKNLESVLPELLKTGFVLGNSIHGMHENKYVHRQIHFSNFYFIDNRFHIDDWGTLVDLKTVDIEDVPKYMTMDIRMPQQNVEKILTFIGNGIKSEYKNMFSVSFVNAVLSGYFAEGIDALEFVTDKIRDDVSVITHIIKTKKKL